MKPYKTAGPAVISFSGGRSSAFMLCQILMAHNWKLPDDVHVIFANTGRELNQTLDFVNECSEQWGIRIVWLEFDAGPRKYRVTNYSHAARHGQPFAALISKKQALPNPRMRFCTSGLKIVPIEKWMKNEGYDSFDTVVGIRADEPKRVAAQRAKPGYQVPMAAAGHGIRDIDAFWAKQSFKLELPINPDGTCSLSNCDLCYLKGHSIKQAIIREQPGLATWWAEQEQSTGHRFRYDRPSYQDMKNTDDDQMQLFDEPSLSCFCGD